MLSLMKQIRRQEAIHKDDVTDSLKKKKCFEVFLFTDTHLSGHLCPGDAIVMQPIGESAGKT